MSRKFSTTVEQIPPSGIRKFFELVIGAEDIISLGVGEPDFTTPWKITEQAYHMLEKGFTSYTSNWGLLEFREAVSNYFQKRFNQFYNPNNEIMATVGVSEGIDIALRAIINPGDEVIIPEPCYVSYKPLVTLAGGIPITINTEPTSFKVTAKQIEEKITEKTKAVILCFPNNPTGVSLSKEELIQISDVAKKHDIWVFSDEVYAELSYEQDPISFANIEGMKDYTVIFSGFSKTHAMTGWRIGYICAPSDFLTKAIKIHQYSMLCAPIMSQYAAIEALVNCEEDVQQMKESYKERKNLFANRMNEIGLKTIPPEGALYAFVDIQPTKLSSEEFAIQLLKQQKVAVIPGTAFGDSGEGYVRCCYATDIEALKEAIERIGTFVNSLK